jgi:hypothetical protein
MVAVYIVCEVVIPSKKSMCLPPVSGYSRGLPSTNFPVKTSAAVKQTANHVLEQEQMYWINTRFR